MTLITDAYRAEQQALHASTEYGTASIAEAEKVANLLNANPSISTVLDYGAGRGNLIRTLHERKLVTRPFTYRPYEPANAAHPDWAEHPGEQRFDLVACIDVLEHIEPECLDGVLDDLARLTDFLAYVTVHTGPAAKTLSDGRNAHLIQQGARWWLPKLLARFDLQLFHARPNGFACLLINPSVPEA